MQPDRILHPPRDPKRDIVVKKERKGELKEPQVVWKLIYFTFGLFFSPVINQLPIFNTC